MEGDLQLECQEIPTGFLRVAAMAEAVNISCYRRTEMKRLAG
jgi:hypothetical protein